ncbi:hypothetical protein [Afipia broomeae]|uniref:Uncharacterized protein n=1 Tax=Afipia broomeae ATCC 49717 TaxID=883078 RepID=K8P7Y8_9BRAD|nr:hypothetical protein [Afipia broomeae]EKS34508.1 hypothetical protein HMPREF9695_04418 [Afipia broomeae ATCC 49717]
MKTKHPCDGMTRAEVNAFEAIAVNQKTRCSKRTLDRLLARGLIEKLEENISFRDGLPPAITTDFYVPFPIHYQWCEWAAGRYG